MKRVTEQKVVEMKNIANAGTATEILLFRTEGQRGITLLFRNAYEKDKITHCKTLKEAYDILYGIWQENESVEAAQTEGFL